MVPATLAPSVKALLSIRFEKRLLVMFLLTCKQKWGICVKPFLKCFLIYFLLDYNCRNIERYFVHFIFMLEGIFHGL